MKSINSKSILQKNSIHDGNFGLRLLQWLSLLLVVFGNIVKNEKKFYSRRSTLNFFKQNIMTPQNKLLKWSFLLVLLFSGVNAFGQNPYPNTGDHQVCINDTEPYGVELHAGSTYAWTVTPLAGGNGIVTAGATPNLITVTWTTLGTATMQVTETNSFGCAGDPVTIIITVNPKPTLVITNPLAVCSPGTANLTLPAVTAGSTGVAGLTYWTNAAATTTYATPTAAPAGTYYIKATNASGCFDIKPVVVTVNPLLSPTINCGTSTTSSVSFTWAAVGTATGYNVSYTINGGAANNIGAIGNVLTYTVNGLSGGDNVVITVTPTGTGCFAAANLSCIATACTPATAAISYATPFCSALTTAQAVTLTGTGTFTGGTYSSTAGLSINATTGAITPSTSTAGPYVVTYTIAATGGCTAVTATANVTITAQVTPTFTAVTAICSGGTLTALPTLSNNSITGSWSPALNNTTTTLYTFTPDAGQCATTATMTITVNPILSPTINCGTSTTNSVSFTWAAVGAATGYNVSYTINGGAANNIGAIGNVFTYTVNGLSGGDNVAITVTPTGVGCFSASTQSCVATACTPATANISYATPFCIATAGAQSVTLTGTGTFTGGTYSSIPAGLSINATTGAITPGISTAGLYTVTYTIAATGGCAAVTATAPVVITSQLVPTFTGLQTAICIGGTLTALPATSDNGITGTWSPALNNTTTTSYTFTPTAGQCASTFPHTITVNPLPTPVITGPTPVCQTIGTNYSTYSTPNVAGHTYTWTVIGGAIVTGQGTNSITVNWTTVGAGNVSVAETITATTCSANAAKPVTINPKPITTPISHN
jgi:hypothetical protein